VESILRIITKSRPDAELSLNTIITKRIMQEKKTLEKVPIRYIKGVGPRKSDLFGKIGIETVRDLFYYLPRRYEDRSLIVEIKDLRPGLVQGTIGKITGIEIFRAKTGKCIVEMVITSAGRKLFAVWYNQPFMKKFFEIGQIVALYGKIELQKHLQITHPTFEILDNKKLEDSLNIGRIVPIYSLTENLNQKYLRNIIKNALDTYLKSAADLLPTQIRARKKLVDFRYAVQNIHFPRSGENLERAYKRLVFEEFFVLQTAMAMKRGKIRKKGIAHKINSVILPDFEKLFSFSFTDAQKKCIKEIERDMAGSKPMHRLLQGDVGSGKTVVAMRSAFIASDSEYQTAVMAPTEVLARQHYVTFSKIFMPLGINVRLLISGIETKAKAEIKKEISLGESDIIIGTHSLFQEDVEYGRLGLVIIDEQHKFGVRQREALRSKGVMPDLLVMTATPIPRSLSLTVFGDMDVSVLNEKPSARAAVATCCLDENKREAVYKFIREEVKKGRQAFIVYPQISAKDITETRAAVEMHQHLQKDIFNDMRLALLHGKMAPDEKKDIMAGFRDKKFDILIATTVIEVGVDIPNVTVMVVEHAEKYGLAQLHQLRGRIGRGRHASYCILMSRGESEVSAERLSAIVQTDDGFEIAEKDLDIRGPGEFLGTRQSGLPELRFGDVVKDFAIMEEAREEAFNLVKNDPELKDVRNMELKNSIRERFKW